MIQHRKFKYTYVVGFGDLLVEAVEGLGLDNFHFQLRWEYHEAKKNFPDCNDTASISSQLMFRLKIMGKSLEDIIK